MAVAFAGLVAACAPGAPFDGELPPVDSVALQLPQMAPVRDHPLSETTGWMYLVSRDAAAQVNRWTTGLHAAASWVVERARTERPTSHRTPRRTWGPWPDPEGRDLRWRLVDDDTEVVVEASTSGADAWVPVVRWSGSSDDGVMVFEFDGFAVAPDLGRWVTDVVRTYSGAIEVRHLRRDDRLDLEITFVGFEALDAMPARTWASDETWRYARDPGAGVFRGALFDAFDSIPFTGPAIDRMELDMTWDAADAGRAHGEIFEGDLEAGAPLVLDECWDASGTLTWRAANPEYVDLLPEYPLGDESACAVADPRP